MLENMGYSPHYLTAWIRHNAGGNVVSPLNTETPRQHGTEEFVQYFLHPRAS